MSEFLASPTLDYLLRLLLAAACGGAIGLERSFRRKEAGVRTHMILSLASALFMILSKYAFFQNQGGADPTMIACQIVMGINFLGAGIIFRTKNSVTTGLTTTAGIWATTAIGMACGAGMRAMAILCTLLTLALHLTMNRLNIGGSALLPQELQITMRNSPRLWDVLSREKQARNIQILSSRINRKSDEKTITLILQIRAEKPITFEDTLRLIDQNPDIHDISI